MTNKAKSIGKHGPLILLSGIAFVLGIGFADYLIGPDYTSLLAYLIPVIVVTRYVGRAAGIFISLVSAFIWILADILADPNHAFRSIALWNHTEKLAVFLIIVFILIRLAQEEEEKRNMISMLAHDMKNPAMVAKGFSTRLLKDRENTLTEQQKGYARLIDHELSRLELLILDFLEMSRLGSKKFELNTVPMDISSHIRKHMDAASLEARKKAITISLECPEETLPEVLADEAQVDRIISNLVGNAINYTENGGTVTIKITPQNRYLMVQVADTGRGIPKEHIKDIFTPFHRVKNDSPGTGLGLPIVKSLIKAHGGKIWVESVPDQGSTFSFTLPRCTLADTESKQETGGE